MKADTLEHKSPAEFFAENKNIAGFDNVRRKFFTESIKLQAQCVRT